MLINNNFFFLISDISLNINYQIQPNFCMLSQVANFKSVNTFILPYAGYNSSIRKRKLFVALHQQITLWIASAAIVKSSGSKTYDSCM